MGTLDSRIALALMAKAELVFGQPGVVLSFPVASSSYTASQLNFFPDAPTAESARQALAGLFDFSAFANAIPDGRIWQTLGDRPALPQVYRRVLEGAEVAALPENQQDLEQLQAARALLLQSAPDGTLVDTPTYAAYKECRDAWLLASQQYNAAKASGELGDPAARQAWEAAEPDLRAVRDRAATAWDLEGHRAEVDDALAKISMLNQKTPSTTWGEWDTRSRSGIGTVTGLAGPPFWPTYISPANACDSGWQLMRLNSSEVQALQASAPEQLKARLGSGGATLNVDELDFEYTPIALSSGAEPYAGECPLYASGVVFFRRIRATVQGETGDVAAKLGALGDKLDMGFLTLNRQRLQVVSSAAAQSETLAPSAASARMIAGTLRGGALAATLRQPAAGSVRADVRVTNGPPGPGSARQRFAMNAILNKRLVIRKTSQSPPIIPVPVPPPQPGKSVLETSPDDIFVLALICSVVPPSPNPDPGLKWSG